MRNFVRKVLIQGLVALAGTELLLNLFFPWPDPYARSTFRYNLYLPVWNHHAIEPPFTDVFVGGPLAGVSTKSTNFSLNRFGYLYDESDGHRRDNTELRIGVVGGSTVECIVLDNGKRWPDRLREALSRSHDDRLVTVLNFGASGIDTRMHLATVAQYAVKLQLDYLVFMLGANDLVRTRDDFQPVLGDDAFVEFPPFLYEKWIITRSQLARRFRAVYRTLMEKEVVSEEKPYFWTAMEQIKAFPVDRDVRITFPAAALTDYEENLISLAALASGHGITPVFTTQPMLWKPTMSAEEEEVDWLRGTIERDGKRVRISSAEAARSLETLNERLMSACRERGWKCIDLASRVPRTLGYFYDSLHFNEAGAALVAEEVAQLLDRELLGRLRH